MRITHCLMSCDSNPDYLEFWPVVAKAWLKLGIRPVLFYIATNKDARPVEVMNTGLHTFEPLPDIPIKIQASTLRYWGCRYYPEDIVIASDVDLIPLSKKFFVDRLQEIENDYYVYIRAYPRPSNKRKHGLITSPEILRDYPFEAANYLIACYHVGRGDIMSRVWDFSDSWADSCRKMIPYWYMVESGGKRVISYEKQIKRMEKKQAPFCGDEIYPSLRVALSEHTGQDKIKLMTTSEDEFDWIDRYIGGHDKDKLRAGRYSAVHCRRPYSKHKQDIDEFLHLHDSLFPQEIGR